MLQEIVITFAGVFSGGLATWLFSKRRQSSEITGIDIQNAKEILELQKELTLQFKQQHQESLELIKEQQQIINHYQEKCVQIKHCRLF